jgi:hypothetical protein
MLINIAVKNKIKIKIKQVEYFNFYTNKIGFNSACYRIINFFNFCKYKPKSKTFL